MVSAPERRSGRDTVSRWEARLGAESLASAPAWGGECARAVDRVEDPVNPFRHVPPAYSPITLRQIGAAFLGMFQDPEVLEQRAREAIREHYGTDQVVFTDSGTSALRLAIEIACEGAEDPVVALPAYSCYDVATALPTPEHFDMYRRVKDELAEMGIEFPY